MALPVFVILLYAAMMSLAALAAKVGCADAAGVTARAVARGEPAPAIGSGILPEGSEVSVRHDGDLVRVTVRRRVWSPLLSGFMVEQEAVAMIEPSSATGSSPAAPS